MATDDGTRRDRLLATLAVLMGLMAISNFAKPLGQAMDPGGNAGFVFFGQRLHGTANAIIGPVFGLVLAAYAYGVWRMKRWVVPLAGAYAVYVIVNLVLFTANPPLGDRPSLLFMLGYALVAIGVSSGGALYVYRRLREAELPDS
jgi:hypothetical protein